jgi:hypothetical protein
MRTYKPRHNADFTRLDELSAKGASRWNEMYAEFKARYDEVKNESQKEIANEMASLIAEGVSKAELKRRPGIPASFYPFEELLAKADK